MVCLLGAKRDETPAGPSSAHPAGAQTGDAARKRLQGQRWEMLDQVCRSVAPLRGLTPHPHLAAAQSICAPRRHAAATLHSASSQGSKRLVCSFLLLPCPNTQEKTTFT